MRQFHDLVQSQNAQSGILITPNGFTTDAWKSSRGKSLQLIDGVALLELLRAARLNPGFVPEPQADAQSSVGRERRLSPEMLSAMNWREFEAFVGHVYRRAGYHVDLRGGSQPDGGIDLILYGDKGRVLVQCKHWKAYQVGVRQVRELFGVMVSEQAAGAILITTHKFTQEAQRFAAGKPIQLVDGRAFIALAHQVQREQPMALLHTAATEIETTSPNCPVCCRPMRIRTARSGVNVGNQFWGCPAYPKCRGTRPLR